MRSLSLSAVASARLIVCTKRAIPRCEGFSHRPDNKYERTDRREAPHNVAHLGLAQFDELVELSHQVARNVEVTYLLAVLRQMGTARV